MPVLFAIVPAWLDEALGLQLPPADLNFWQMAARTVVVFIWGVVIVRLGDRRLLGKNAGFDVLLVVVLGSVLSRGINGQAAFGPTLAVSALLVGLHHLLGSLACRFDGISRLLKGSARILIHDGKPDRAELRRCKISEDDLEENLRLNGNVAGIPDVAEARLERNGTVSVIKHAKRSK